VLKRFDKAQEAAPLMDGRIKLQKQGESRIYKRISPRAHFDKRGTSDKLQHPCSNRI